MGQGQSRDELLYQHAIDGDLETIKTLSREGAGLEWIDKDGKTPLIIACMTPDRFLVAKTLIELGANVNAYRPGRHAGTPLHHAAKRGLDQTVQLLLCHGANPLVTNDDCQTPLDVARTKGFRNVVRTIERHVCVFSGWLREFYGPGFLEALAPKLLSRRIWAVIIPRNRPNPSNPLKLELAIYSTIQEARPRAIIALWKATIQEPKFDQPDPGLIILDHSNKLRYKFASATEGDKQQLQNLFKACTLEDTQVSAPAGVNQIAGEVLELARGVNASIQSSNRPIVEADITNGWGSAGDLSIDKGWGGPNPSGPSSRGWINGSTEVQYSGWERTSNESESCHNGRDVTKIRPSDAGSSGWLNEPEKDEYNGWSLPESKPAYDIPGKSIQRSKGVCLSVDNDNAIPASVPSAPPIPEEGSDEGSIRYPSIEFSQLDLSNSSAQHGASGTTDPREESTSSLCIICWEAPVQGACIPCGHMVGCMPCLSDIRDKKGDCPVCRAKIDQIIRIYAV